MPHFFLDNTLIFLKTKIKKKNLKKLFFFKKKKQRGCINNKNKKTFFFGINAKLVPIIVLNYKSLFTA
jgi:hypothetical protein